MYIVNFYTVFYEYGTVGLTSKLVSLLAKQQ